MFVNTFIGGRDIFFDAGQKGLLTMLFLLLLSASTVSHAACQAQGVVDATITVPHLIDDSICLSVRYRQWNGVDIRWNATIGRTFPSREDCSKKTVTLNTVPRWDFSGIGVCGQGTEDDPTPHW